MNTIRFERVPSTTEKEIYSEYCRSSQFVIVCGSLSVGNVRLTPYAVRKQIFIFAFDSRITRSSGLWFHSSLTSSIHFLWLVSGEVFVLDDGGEVDLDLGNYERFLDITLHRDNNITTGKIYKQVIEKERRGDYLGKTVQVVPHITDAIQEWVERVAVQPVKANTKPQVCIVELGGTIGDIEGMPFVEAFRQFQFRVKRENFCVAHVSLVPMPRTTGEPKTKPTQSSVREL